MESITLAAVVGLVGFGIWEVRDWLPNFNSQGANAAYSPLAKRPSAANSVKPAKASPAGNQKIASRHTAGTDGPVSIFPTPPIVVYVPPAPVPDTSSFSPGVTRSQLREQYGEPSLNVEARQNGHLVERYFYNSDKTHYVVVTLNDGSVVTSETISR